VPIKPENKARYPRNWAEIRAHIMERSGGRCECEGECGQQHHGRCLERHGRAAYSFRGKVVITIAHLDHTPENCDDDNLRAMCQRCHNRYDSDHRAQTRRATRDGKSGQQRMPWMEDDDA
jgi:hypothetical protein